MKPLLFLLLLSASAHAQSPIEKARPRNMEIALNLGHAFDNAYLRELQPGGYIRSSVSALKRSGNLQFGVTVEGGTNSSDFAYVSPGLLMNAIFPSREAYFYLGAMTGYIFGGDMLGDYRSQGYVLGLQTGFVQPVSKRLSFTSELAVRSAQTWEMDHRGEWGQTPDVTLYLPVTIGLRYRF